VEQVIVVAIFEFFELQHQVVVAIVEQLQHGLKK
jgi:hypothetical protein